MFESVRDWLLSEPSRALETDTMVVELIARLQATALEFERLSLSIRTFHPELFVDNYRWTPDTGVIKSTQPNTLLRGRAYRASPIIEIHGGVDEVRVALPDEGHRYPLTEELAEQGFRYYVALALPGGPHRSFISFATKSPAGFGPQLERLHTLLPALSLRIELLSQRSATENLLRAYLGNNAARRVLAGAFRRGEGEQIRAVIWTCDLRGFTSMVDRSPSAEVLATLDRYFECVADPIAAHGGEVLKFIGDAVLAIFVDPEAELDRACAAALDATREAFAALVALNEARAEAGHPSLDFGVALHVGEVMYGNIGATGRLDFTVIGKAVNEVTRVEALCKSLGRRLLLSESFAQLYAPEDLTRLGPHQLRGVSEPIELFTLADLAPA